MRVRSKGRSLALQYLYQIDICKEESSEEMLTEFFEYVESEKESEVFARRILQGVITNREMIDGVIAESLKNWDINRISIVDKNILRIATFELFNCVDIPARVVVNEAIDLGKNFGSKDTGSFINGVLDRILRSKSLT